MIIKILISFCIGLILTFFGIDSVIAQKNPKRFYIIDESKDYLRLPFEFINNLIVIQVQVNNSDTLNFILDTGITTTIISSNIPSLEPLKSLKEYWVRGLGKGSEMLAKHSPENDIEIMGVLGQHQDLLIAELDQSNLSNLLGIPIHGLIGYALFKDFIVEINYDEHYLILNTPRKYTYKLKRKQVTIPLIFFDSKPHIDAIAIQKNHTKIPVTLLIDLGASHSIWLNLLSNPLLQLPEKNAQVYLGVGLNGLLSGRIGRLKKFAIGRFVFEDILVNYPDTVSIGNAIRMDYRNGSIGSELLRRFNIIIDYRNQKLILTPNNSIKQPFRYNMSGIEIETPKPGEPIYQISFIRKNSPADKAGLKEGDQILRINGESTKMFSLTEITNIFLDKPGKKITIQYIRNKEVKWTSLILEEIL
jgi:hypothetical protein